MSFKVKKFHIEDTQGHGVKGEYLLLQWLPRKFIRRADVMLQREFAEREVADPGVKPLEVSPRRSLQCWQRLNIAVELHKRTPLAR